MGVTKYFTVYHIFLLYHNSWKQKFFSPFFAEDHLQMYENQLILAKEKHTERFRSFPCVLILYNIQKGFLNTVIFQNIVKTLK